MWPVDRSRESGVTMTLIGWRNASRCLKPSTFSAAASRFESWLHSVPPIGMLEQRTHLIVRTSRQPIDPAVTERSYWISIGRWMTCVRASPNTGGGTFDARSREISLFVRARNLSSLRKYAGSISGYEDASSFVLISMPISTRLYNVSFATTSGLMH